MPAGQIAVQQRRLGGPFITALVIGAFAVGVGTGVGVLRAVDTRSTIAAVPAPATNQAPVTAAGALGQTMSEAAYAAMHRAVAPVTAAGGLGQTMSDAAYAAMHPAAATPTATH